MNTPNPKDVIYLRVPFHNTIQNMILNDPWRQAHINEINDYNKLTFPSFYSTLKEEASEITEKTKVRQLLEDIREKLQIQNEIYLFQYDYFHAPFKIQSRHFMDKSVFIISQTAGDYLLERELIPLLTREFAYYLYYLPDKIPLEFLYQKLQKLQAPEEQNKILRVLYLANIRNAIEQDNCDRLAIYFSNFETLVCALLQFDTINNKKRIPFNLERTIRAFPKKWEELQKIHLKDYTNFEYRIVNMFLFSQKHNLVESKSLRSLRIPGSTSGLMDMVTINETYHKILNASPTDSIFTRLKQELISIFP